MKHKKLIIGSTLGAGLLALSAATILQAGPIGSCEPGARHAMFKSEHGRHAGPMKMLRKLDLTEEQQDKVFELMHKQKPAMRDKMKEMREGRKAIREAVMSDTYDAKQVNQLADKQGRMVAEMIKMRTSNFNQIYTLLTPEQKIKAKEMRGKFEQRFN